MNGKIITSYGLIVYYKDTAQNEAEPYFLIQQRRDTFDFIDFMKGVYTTEDTLITSLSGLTHDERNRVQNYIFDEIWMDLWLDTYLNITADWYNNAKRKFNIVRDLLPSYIPKLCPPPHSAPWGFPKGRKNSGEKSLDCALREFEEETTISRQNIQLICRKAIVEFYHGTNGKKYCTNYFIATMDSKTVPKRRQTLDRIRKDTVSDEAMELKWVTCAESKEYLSPARHILLKRIYENIKNDIYSCL
jgi:8-oxo-dGTP pyrophosphatase MutT (NUDIX family)